MTGIRPRRIDGPIVLVGLSGAGKTVVGRRLAERLGWAFIDLDTEIERLAGKRIPHIFAEAGEADFRSLEAEATSAIETAHQTVIATGGGWMDRPELRDRWPAGMRVWLQVDPSVALERLAEDRATRPLLSDPRPAATLVAILAARLPSYALSEYTVRTDGRPADGVVEEIMGLLEGRKVEADRRER